MEVFLHNIQNLRQLKFIRDEENTFVTFEDWINFLRSQSSNGNTIRRSNILKEFRNHRNGLIERDGKLFVTISSLLRYVANHCENLEICDKILSDVIFCVLKKEPVPETRATLNVYEQVAKLNTLSWSNSLLQTVSINNSRTLYTDYKHCFSDEEWKKICLFEHHFVRSYPDYLTFEEELKKKEQFLCEIIQLQKIAKN